MRAQRVRRLLLAAGVTGFAFAVPAMAEIHGWVDAQGNVTYSNLPPPPGVKITDVIREEPIDPQALAEARLRSEQEQRRDKIRLLELEQARAQRTVVDYPAPPPAPPLAAGLGCGPNGQYDCFDGSVGWPVVGVLPYAVWGRAGRQYSQSYGSYGHSGGWHGGAAWPSRPASGGGGRPFSGGKVSGHSARR